MQNILVWIKRILSLVILVLGVCYLVTLIIGGLFLELEASFLTSLFLLVIGSVFALGVLVALLVFIFWFLFWYPLFWEEKFFSSPATVIALLGSVIILSIGICAVVFIYKEPLLDFVGNIVKDILGFIDNIGSGNALQ